MGPLRRLPVAEVAISRDRFADILRKVAEWRRTAAVHGIERSRVMSSRKTTGEVRQRDEKRCHSTSADGVVESRHALSAVRHSRENDR
jgi:hypothetical protein